MDHKREYQTPAVESYDSVEIVRLIGPALGYSGGGGTNSGAFGDLVGRGSGAGSRFSR